MGIYNLYGELEIQLKVGDVGMEYFKVGDEDIQIPDGVYLGYEGVVVIWRGRFIAEFKSIFNKWGDELSPRRLIESQNPVTIVLKETIKNVRDFNQGSYKRAKKKK